MASVIPFEQCNIQYNTYTYYDNFQQFLEANTHKMASCFYGACMNINQTLPIRQIFEEFMIHQNKKQQLTLGFNPNPRDPSLYVKNENKRTLFELKCHTADNHLSGCQGSLNNKLVYILWQADEVLFSERILAKIGFTHKHDFIIKQENFEKDLSTPKLFKMYIDYQAKDTPIDPDENFLELPKETLAETRQIIESQDETHEIVTKIEDPAVQETGSILKENFLVIGSIAIGIVVLLGTICAIQSFRTKDWIKKPKVTPL